MTVQHTSGELAAYHRFLDEKFDEIDELLADLPAAALVWRPFDESPWKGPSSPLGLILAHSMSSTIYLLRRALWVLERIDWKAVDGDEGREEFGPANLDPAYLRARSGRARALAHELLASVAPDDLDCSRPHARRPELVFNVRYEIVHAIEHMSQHAGHAQITRQLYALEASRPLATDN